MLVSVKEMFVISTWGGEGVWWREKPFRRKDNGRSRSFCTYNLHGPMTGENRHRQEVSSRSYPSTETWEAGATEGGDEASGALYALCQGTFPQRIISNNVRSLWCGSVLLVDASRLRFYSQTLHVSYMMPDTTCCQDKLFG